MGCRSFCAMASVLLCLVLATPCAEGAYPGEILRKGMTLYPAPKPSDAYSLFYDISVQSPGLLHIGLHVDRVLPEPKGKTPRFVRVQLLSREGNKTIGQVLCEPGGSRLEHGVDAFELEKTKGQYRIVVSNESIQYHAEVRLIVRHIVNEQSGAAVEGPPKKKPDLMIEKIYLTSDKRIAVVVKNRGQGILGDQAWDSTEGATLFVEGAGGHQDNVELSKLDPHHKLKKPDGSVTHVTGLKVVKPTNVSAYIRCPPQIEEVSRENNRKRVTLHP